MIIARFSEQRSWVPLRYIAHVSYAQLPRIESLDYLATTVTGEKMEFALPQSVPRMCVKLELAGGEDLYRVLQQEVVLGVEALKSGSPEIAVTLFQNALQKVNIEHPFYDHLNYNLLLSYSLLIEQLLKRYDQSTAHYFVQAALQLEMGSKQAHDPTILQRFSDGFQSLGVMLLKHGLTEASRLCGRKANSIVKGTGSYMSLKTSLSAPSRERLTVQT